jgi:orotidine-5'-phosphate decarboxylase
MISLSGRLLELMCKLDAVGSAPTLVELSQALESAGLTRADVDSFVETNPRNYNRAAAVISTYRKRRIPAVPQSRNYQQPEHVLRMSALPRLEFCAMEHFADRLAAAVTRTGNPVCVGLDPRAKNLPVGLLRAGEQSYSALAEAYARFCNGVSDVVAPLVPIVKVQAAFFEELGPPGMTAMAHVIDHAQERGLLVIVDAKRNDIGSTVEAYARGYLGRDASAWHADALTVSPYLGDDSLTPFVEVARERAAGIFVLVKTSNPGGGLLQDAKYEGGTLYGRVAEHVEGLAAATAGKCGYGAVGAVVGATYPAQLVELRRAMPRARSMGADWARSSTIRAESSSPTSGLNMRAGSARRAGSRRSKPRRAR